MTSQHNARLVLEIALPSIVLVTGRGNPASFSVRDKGKESSMSTVKLQDLLVVLVEPSATQRRIIGRQLAEIGIHQIEMAPDGARALQRIRALRPDLVVSTLYLPDMTGTDLVHEMRNDDELQRIAFMLISSETRFRYLDPIRQAGVIAILPKPFSAEALRVALNSTIDYLDDSELDAGDYAPEELEVLVVDDSPLARKHIGRVLRSMGIERLTEASDGIEALALLRERFFDLVVTDYNMPNMDGRELVDEIRNHSGQASVPIMMVTSEENENRLAAVQQSGVSAICDKPFDPGSVKQLLQQIFAA